MSSVDLSHPDAHLNSIMILLIQMQHHATLTYDINLNSIMILLILKSLSQLRKDDKI